VQAPRERAGMAMNPKDAGQPVGCQMATSRCKNNMVGHDEAKASVVSWSSPMNMPQSCMHGRAALGMARGRTVL
jgi:hypothetical protein